MRRIALAAGLALAFAVPAAAAPTKSVVIKATYSKALKSTILVDGRGHSLYLLTSDPKNQSTCAALDPSCPHSWPAVRPPAVVGAGAKASLLGKTTNGKQVTYAGHPLYYYAGDKKAGDLNGQGFVSIWYVVSPKGTAIKKQ